MNGDKYRMELLYEKPLEILKQLPLEGSSDMSMWQLAYLCGLIKTYKPQKVVEIGVSAGGTTAVLLNCLSKLHINGKVYSIDIESNYKGNPKYKIGFLADYAKEIVKDCPKHEMLVGISPQFIDYIGNEIEFLILDTVHLMPGEILDFLVCFPYLKKDAVVVLHDVILHKYGKGIEFATQVLLDCVTGRKMPVFGYDNDMGYPNIAAFQINSDTGKYIYDVFSVLLLPWQYNIQLEDVALYRETYIKLGYSKECIEVFDCALKKKSKTISEHIESRIIGMNQFVDLLGEIAGCTVYIYGAGIYGTRLNNALKNHCNIGGFIVSDEFETSEQAICISDYHSKDKEVILIAAKKSSETIEKQLIQHGIKNYRLLDEGIYSLLMIP